MLKEEGRKISVEVSRECLKKLKILAIHKDVTLQEYVKDLLEKNADSKKVDKIVEEIAR